MKSKISSFFEKKSGKLALSGIIFALALVVALTTVFVLNGKKLENKTTPPTNAETTIVPNNSDNWTNAGNYDTVNISTGAGFTDGNGTEADPYIITTARQLAGLSYLAGRGGIRAYKYYKLGGNINLLDHYWTPIGTDSPYYFNGSFDGDGYVISGMVVSGSFSYAGLFGYMKGETGETFKISNLGIENSEIKVTSSARVGGLVGYSASSILTITNSYNTGSVSATSSFYARAGGLVGESSSTLTIINSYNTGSVSATSSSSSACAGGLVGDSSSLTIENSYNTGSVSATSSSFARAGGLAGNSSFYLTIKNSYNTGSVDASGSTTYKGGLIGQTNSGDTRTIIKNSYFDGDVFSGRMIENVGATITASGKVAGLSGLMKDTANYGSESFGIYTDDKSATGNAVWSSESPWDFENVWGEDVFGTNNGYPVLRNEEYNDYFADLYWKYNAATSYAGGDGTQSSPYLISSAQELALLSNDVNSGKYYDQYIYAKLTDNIDLAGKIWTPIGKFFNNSIYSFHGSFDGNGYVVKNMTIEFNVIEDMEGVGVFGFFGDQMSGETSYLSNLGVENYEIQVSDKGQSFGGMACIAPLVGVASSTNIANCYANGKILKIEKNTGFYIESGLIGAAMGCEIKNCYAVNEFLDASCSAYGGIVGAGPMVNILNSFAVIDFSTFNSSSMAGLIGSDFADMNGPGQISVTNSYYDGNLGVSKMIASASAESQVIATASGKVSGLSGKMKEKTNYGVSSFGTYTDDNSLTGNAVWTKAWDFQETWMIEQGFNFEYPIFQTMMTKMWKYDDNVLAITGFSKGLGTAESPYQISTAEGLAYLSILANQGNTKTYKYYELTADIDLSGKYWTPISNKPNSYYFSGSFDGNGYVINGMTIDMKSSSDVCAGLFGCMGGETGQTLKISNLGIENSEINVTSSSSTVFAGGLVGLSYSSLTIENNYNMGSIRATSSSASVYAGGLVGDARSSLTITNSYNTTSVNEISFATSFAGGLVGEASSSPLTITNSYNTGNVSAEATANFSIFSANAGGLVGEASSSTLTITNSYNTGSVNATSSGAIETSARAGGLMGYSTTSSTLTITNSFNSGRVSGKGSSNYVGGIVGYVIGSATINNTFCTGDIQSPTGSGTYVKPIVGRGTATITNSYYKLDMLDSSGGVVSSEKGYYSKGASDTVAFDGDIWFYHADLNEGLPLLRSLFWAEASIANQSDVLSVLTNKGFKLVA